MNLWQRSGFKTKYEAWVHVFSCLKEHKKAILKFGAQDEDGIKRARFQWQDKTYVLR